MTDETLKTTPLNAEHRALGARMVGFGAMGPSRDIIVRKIAPEHARGKVYGFVYSGLDVGGLVGPLVFGWFLDRGHPAWVFAGAAVIMLAAIPTVLGIGRRPAWRLAARSVG